MRGPSRRRAVLLAGCLLLALATLPAAAAGELPASAGASVAAVGDGAAGAGAVDASPAATAAPDASPGATAAIGADATTAATHAGVTTNASGAHARNVTGDGVRVAVIDNGFTRNRSSYADNVVANHTINATGPDAGGGYMAEAVVAQAPDVELVLYAVNRNQSGRVAAIEHAVETADVDLILLGSRTRLWGPQDGTAPIARAVDDAVARGVPVVTAAGNHGNRSVWRGGYNDSDDDGIHEFANGREQLRIEWATAPDQTVAMQWNGWAHPGEDYRITVTGYTCWGCARPRPDAPVRYRSFLGGADLADVPTTEDSHYLSIEGVNATEGRQLTVWTENWRGTRLTPTTRNGTLTLAATADRAIVVGGVDRADGTLLGHSGRGPTLDGDRRPHVVAPTNDSAGAYAGRIRTTDLAAARTAGVGALVLQADSDATPAEIRDVLTDTARPVRGDEPTNATGHGLVDASAAVAAASAGDDGPPALPTGVVPTDPDDDGTYEDLNGNEEFDSDDVVTYFLQIDADAIQDNPRYYDVNGNGQADFDDVVELFQRL